MKEIRPFPELEPGTKCRGESRKRALFAYTQSRNPISSGTVSSTLASMSAWYERMSNERDIRLRQHSQLPKCTKPSRDLRPNDNGTSSPFNQSALYLIVDRIGCTPGLNSLSVTRRRKADPKFTNRRESWVLVLHALIFTELAYGTLFRMCNNTVISQPCIENSFLISLADNTNEIASLTAHLMSPFLSCWFVVLFYTSLDW